MGGQIIRANKTLSGKTRQGKNKKGADIIIIYDEDNYL